MFKISFLTKYRVIYYDYIVKWCSGIYNVIGVYRWILSQFFCFRLSVRLDQVTWIVVDLLIITKDGYESGRM